MVQVSSSGKEGVETDISSLGFQIIKPQETPDSLTDAELSSSDYSDTDIDLRENYEYPDESSNESQSQRVKVSGQRIIADIAQGSSHVVAPDTNNPFKTHPQILKCRVSLTRVEQLPLHNKIAEKIKAESLARSSPSDQGPIKCYKCKRLYRTKESWQVHSETCNFEVSTSEDEEGDEELVAIGNKGSSTSEKKVYALRRRGSAVDTPSPVPQEPPVKRGRGRPPKTKPVDVLGESAKSSPSVPKDQLVGPSAGNQDNPLIPTQGPEGMLRRGRSRKPGGESPLVEETSVAKGSKEEAAEDPIGESEPRPASPQERQLPDSELIAPAVTNAEVPKVSPILEKYQRMCNSTQIEISGKPENSSGEVSSVNDVESMDTGPEKVSNTEEVPDTNAGMTEANTGLSEADTSSHISSSTGHDNENQKVNEGVDAKQTAVTTSNPTADNDTKSEDDDLIIIDSDSCPNTPTQPAPSSEYTDIFIGNPDEKRTPPKPKKPSPGQKDKQPPSEPASANTVKVTLGKGADQPKMFSGVRLPDGTTVKVIMSAQHMQNVKPEDLQSLILNSGLPIRAPPPKPAPAPLKELRPKIPTPSLQPGLVNLGAPQTGMMAVNPLQGIQPAISPQAVMQASPTPTQHIQAQVIASPPRAAAQLHNLSPPSGTLVNSAGVLGLLPGRNPANQQAFGVTDNQGLLCPAQAQSLPLPQTHMATAQGGPIAYLVGNPQPQAQSQTQINSGLLAGLQSPTGAVVSHRYVDTVSSLGGVATQQQPAMLASVASGHSAIEVQSLGTTPQSGIGQVRVSVAIPSVAMAQPGVSTASVAMAGLPHQPYVSRNPRPPAADSRPKFVGELLQGYKQSAASSAQHNIHNIPGTQHQSVSVLPAQSTSVLQTSTQSRPSLLRQLPVSQGPGLSSALPATARLQSLLGVKSKPQVIAKPTTAPTAGSHLDNFATIDLTKEPFVETSAVIKPPQTTPPQDRARKSVSISDKSSPPAVPGVKVSKQEEVLVSVRPKGAPSLAFYEGLMDKDKPQTALAVGSASSQPSLVEGSPHKAKVKLSASPSRRTVPNLLARKRRLDANNLNKLRKKVKLHQEDYLRAVKAQLLQKKAHRGRQDGSVTDVFTPPDTTSLLLSRQKKLRKDTLKEEIREDPGQTHMCSQN